MSYLNWVWLIGLLVLTQNSGKHGTTARTSPSCPSPRGGSSEAFT